MEVTATAPVRYLTEQDKRRAFFIELRRGLGIILKAAVVYFGVSYGDLLPREASGAIDANGN